jgi:hypothetical protein
MLRERPPSNLSVQFALVDAVDEVDDGAGGATQE